MANDPLASPPPPPVERLSRGVLLVAALIVMITLLAVAFLVAPRTAARTAAPAGPRLAAGAPGFLDRPPGNLPPSPRPPQSEQDYLRSLAERAALVPQQPAPYPPSPAPEAQQQQPPSYSPAAPAAPPPPPRDLRREEFLRALRAPLAEPLPLVLPVRGGPSQLPEPGATAGLWPARALAAREPAGAPSSRAGATGDSLDEAFPPAPADPQPPLPLPPPPSTPLPPAAVSSLAPQPLRPAAAPRGAGSVASAAVREPGTLEVRFHPAAPGTTLAAGTLIPALLETEVNSDLPGPLLAQVSRDVYDLHQRSVVVPRGTRLLGRYENQVAVGQRRLLVAWTRLTFPDGSGFDLPGLPATDAAGAAGLTARVQNHLLRVFGDALLLSLLAAGADLSQPQNRNLALAPSAGSVASAAVGQELASVGVQLLRRDLSIQPTLRLAAGTPLVVFVNGDLPLAPPDRGHLP